MSAILAVQIAVSSACHAATVFYSTQAGFDTAEPGAVGVSFSGLTNGIRPNSFTLPGVTFSTEAPGSAASALIVYGDSIGNNWFGDTLVLSFGSGVDAVGGDILNQIAEQGSAPQSAPITEDVFSGAILLGQTTVTESSGFFGARSDTPITKVTFFSDCENDCSSLLSNLSIVAPTVTATPLPPALPMFGAVFAGLTGWAATRRRAAARPLDLSSVTTRKA
jgi:hypothetical protein